MKEVINFLKNTIKTRHGQISSPALLSEILSVFKIQGLQEKDVNDPNVSKYINQLIIEEAQRSGKADVADANIGLGVGVEDNSKDKDNSTDFFSSLMPLSRN